MMRLAAAAALFALAACGGRVEGPSVLLVTLDTTRADALGCYGGPAGNTPRLDRLAAEGVLFERAHAVAPVTMPSHASMLTGLYPLRHGVRGNDRWALADDAVTLAELARARGIQTGAAVAAVVVGRAFGLAQGFDSYSEPPPPKGSGVVMYEQRPAGEVIDAAIAWLDARDRARPFFLWVHLFDPHEPYAPPPEFRPAIPGERGLYHGEVAYADRELGRLLDHLDTDGARDATYVLVAGDHGEGLGDHGELTHGALCREPTLRVPLLLRYPDGRRAGERVRSLASGVDVFPTLVEALGLPERPGIDGRSLLGGEETPGRGLYFECYESHIAFGYSHAAGWMDERGKYIHGSTPQFFDLARDPGETRNLAAERGDVIADFAREINALAAARTLAPASSTAPDAATVESLRKLGYASVGPRQPRFLPPLARSARPIAEEVIAHHTRLVAGIDLFHARRFAEAEKAIAAELEAMPWSPAGLLYLSQALIGQGKHAEAIPILERFLAGSPQMAFMLYHLGNCLAQTGRREEAVAPLREAVRLEAGSKEYYPLLIRLLRDLGRWEEAKPLAEAYEQLRLRSSGGARAVER
ncbi:MAG: sulfatase-like hydrolase/transferase [Planctomycetota bacterium]